MPERAPLKGRGVHTAYAYVGTGLTVAAMVVAAVIPGLLASDGPAQGVGDGSTPPQITVEPEPTFADVDPDAPVSPDPMTTGEYVPYRGFVNLTSVSGIDLDQFPPGIAEPGDVTVSMGVGGAHLITPGTPMAKAPTGTVVQFEDVCTTLLAEAGLRRNLVPVFPDDTVCLLTDEGRIASLAIVDVSPADGVRAEVTVWTPKVPPTR